jgi:hypothetical protein
MLDTIIIFLSGIAVFLILAPLVKWYVEAKEEMQEGGADDDVD